MVIFKCKKIHNDVVECMKQYNNEANFKKYKAERERELLQGIPQ